MARRQWDAKTRTALERLKGRSVSELCTAHQISQGKYYQWRDQFLTNTARVFEVTQADAAGEPSGAGERPVEAVGGGPSVRAKPIDEKLL